MTTEEKQEKRIQEIRNLLDRFAVKFLPSDLKAYVDELWLRMRQEPRFAVHRGRPENWASAVVVVVAQLNYLNLPGEGKIFLSEDRVCEFFGTRRYTVLHKAAAISDTLRIQMGAQGLCSPELVDLFAAVRSVPDMLDDTTPEARRRGFRLVE